MMETLTTASCAWTNVPDNRKGDFPSLRPDIPFTDEDITILLKDNHRTRINHRDGYTFMILRFPVYNRKTKVIRPAEIDFVIGKDHLVTVHQNDIPELSQMFDRAQRDPNVAAEMTEKGTESLLYHLLSMLLAYCFPMLEHITVDLHTIEQSIFSGNERAVTKDILNIRRNITDFRETVFHHKDIIKKLIQSQELNERTTEKETMLYYTDLIEMTKEIWSILERQKETVEAFQETNNNLISFKINDVMKVLTMFSAMLLPMSVLFGLFGVNTSIPFLPKRPYDFMVVVSIGALCGLIMYGYFRKKRWI